MMERTQQRRRHVVEKGRSQKIITRIASGGSSDSALFQLLAG